MIPRIMSFGYNAMTLKNVASNEIHVAGHDLLTQLVSCRRGRVCQSHVSAVWPHPFL